MARSNQIRDPNPEARDSMRILIGGLLIWELPLLKVKYRGARKRLHNHAVQDVASWPLLPIRPDAILDFQPTRACSSVG